MDYDQHGIAANNTSLQQPMTSLQCVEKCAHDVTQLELLTLTEAIPGSCFPNMI